MIQFIKKILGMETIDFKELIDKKAQIIDVRTPAEFKNGHIKNAKNIPLQSLRDQLSKIDKNKPVITVCASGMRSASAKSILKQNNFEVYNGGGWTSLQNKIK